MGVTSALVKSPALRGTIVLSFAILAGGRVVDARVAELTMRDAEVKRCVESRARLLWIFASPRGNVDVSARLSFTRRRAEAESTRP